jgi:uncharacterized protein (TIGR02996 family)
MTDPAMLTIAAAAAAAMAGKSAESLSEAAKRAMGALVTKIRQRLRDRPDDEAVLDTVAADPDSETSRLALADALDRLAAGDPAFREELIELSGKAGIQLSGSPVQAHTANIVNAGSVGKVISAGRDINISGDLNL